MSKDPTGKHDFVKQSIGSFLRELGSDSASPGGGAAAALSGALGVSLIEMVSRINVKRAPSAHFRKNISRLEKNRTRFGELMRLDAEAFLKLCKFSKEERRGSRYQSVLRRAAGVPMEICELAVESLAIGQFEINRTSRWLASDLAEAGILLRASFNSGRLNVEINLRSIQDKIFLRKTNSRLDRLEKEADILNRKIKKVLTHE